MIEKNAQSRPSKFPIGFSLSPGRHTEEELQALESRCAVSKSAPPAPSEMSPRAKKVLSVIGHTIGYAILSVIGVLVFGFHTFWIILAVMWFMSDFKKAVAGEVLEGLKTQSPK